MNLDPDQQRALDLMKSALTHVRTFSGLSLDRLIEERDNKRDAAVVAFYQGLLPTN